MAKNRDLEGTPISGTAAPPAGINIAGGRPDDSTIH